MAMARAALHAARASADARKALRSGTRQELYLFLVQLKLFTAFVCSRFNKKGSMSVT